MSEEFKSMYNELWQSFFRRIILSIFCIYDIRCVLAQSFPPSTYIRESEIVFLIALLICLVMIWFVYLPKKRFKKILFINMTIIILLLVYYNTPLSIRSHMWKSMHSCDMPDFMEFGIKGQDVLKWPYIYDSKGEKIGTIRYCYQDYLIVRSANSECDGEYCAK